MVLGRIVLITLSCVIASLAAGFVVTLAVLMPEWSALDLGPFDQGTFGVVVGFGAIFVSAFAFLPALVMIVIAEALAIRTLLYYATAGAVIAAMLYLSFRGWDTLALEVNGFARRELEIMAAAGIVAGCVYWALAGRSAGAWRPPDAPPPPSARIP
jgi:hypothetical protein